MKRLVMIVVILCLVGVLPAAAIDKMDGIALAVVVFDLGVGTTLLLQKNTGAKIIGVFAIGLGVFGILAVSFGWLGGDLLSEIQKQVGY